MNDSNISNVRIGSQNLIRQMGKLFLTNALPIYSGCCLSAPPHQGNVRRQTLPPTKQSFKILNLTPSTYYAVSLSAVTNAGQGETLSTIGRTLPQAGRKR